MKRRRRRKRKKEGNGRWRADQPVGSGPEKREKREDPARPAHPAAFSFPGCALHPMLRGVPNGVGSLFSSVTHTRTIPRFHTLPLAPRRAGKSTERRVHALGRQPMGLRGASPYAPHSEELPAGGHPCGAKRQRRSNVFHQGARGRELMFSLGTTEEFGRDAIF